MAVFQSGSGGGGGGGNFPAVIPPPTFYVSTNGSDGTGDGSILKPYATLNHLNSKILNGHGQPSSSNPFTIFIENGVYNEGDNNEIFYPNCFYCGYGLANSTIIQTNTAATLYSPGFAMVLNDDNILGIRDLTLASDMNFDMPIFGGNGGLNIYIDDVTCNNGNFILVGRNGDGDILFATALTASNNVTLNGVPGGRLTSCILGNIAVASSNSGSSITMISCVGTSLFASSNTNSVFINLFSSFMGSMNITGDNTSVNADVTSLPAAGSIVGANLISLTSSAPNLGYIPGTGTIYDGVVENVQEALDDLGSRAPLTPVVKTGNFTAAPGNIYFIEGTVTIAMPATMAANTYFEIMGVTGSWTLTIPTGQTVTVATRAVTNNSIGSTYQTDSIRIYCNGANTTFVGYIITGYLSLSSGFIWGNNDNKSFTPTPNTVVPMISGQVYAVINATNLTLPTIGIPGQTMAVYNHTTGSFTIKQNAGQQIICGSSATTVGTGGSLASTSIGDCVTLTCITSSLYIVSSVIGNITVV